MKNPVRDLTEKNREYRADAILGIERLSDIVRSLKGASYDDWPRETRWQYRVMNLRTREGDVDDEALRNTGFRLARTKK